MRAADHQALQGHAVNRVGLIDQARHARVLALWRGGRHDTRSISIATGLTEQEVCTIISEGER